MKLHYVRQTLDVSPSLEPGWAASARQHFNETGGYRPEDVRKLLGDPSQRVEILAVDDTELCCRVAPQL